MRIQLLVATAVALLPLAGIAQTETPPPPSTPSAQGSSFDALDANKDGRISMPEASADPKLVESFSAADKNGDGYLDNTEYETSVTPPQQ